MKRAKRIQQDERRELIIEAAIKLAKEIGYTKITRDEIAKRAKVSSALVGFYFTPVKILRVAVMEAAVEKGIVEILAQGLTLNDPRALQINEPTKQKVLSYISRIT